MKRIVTLLLVLAMVFSLVACGSGDTGAAKSDYKIGIITRSEEQHV